MSSPVWTADSGSITADSDLYTADGGLVQPAGARITPADLITLALKQTGVLGVGQTATAEDMNDGLVLLNMMLGQWSRKRWLLYHLLDASKISTGALSYSIGSGGDINVIRPDRIEDAFVRFVNQTAPNQVDTPLTVLPSREDYDRIPLKGQIGFPQVVFYDSGFPLGSVYVWPVPAAGLYEIHLILKADLGQLTSLTQRISLPPEYQEALLYNLAVRLCENWGRPQRPGTMALAKSSLAVLRAANTQIATLRMPDGLVRGRYNVYSDSWR